MFQKLEFQHSRGPKFEPGEADPGDTGAMQMGSKLGMPAQMKTNF